MIKSSAITRAGFEYQDLIGIQTLIEFYRDPQKYKWIELESQDKEISALDDKQVLHMIAGTDFKWTVAGIRYCTGHGLEEIDFLFEHQRTGVMPFHGSILAYNLRK